VLIEQLKTHNSPSNHWRLCAYTTTGKSFISPRVEDSGAYGSVKLCVRLMRTHLVGQRFQPVPEADRMSDRLCCSTTEFTH
jgi:hypothetical protein